MSDEAALLVMRFAFPCAEISVQLGHVTPDEYARIEEALLAQEPLPRSEIERFWPALFRRLKEVAAAEGLDYWSIENLRRHYLLYHDRYIDDGDGLLGEMMPCEKELCRARVGTVLDVLDNGVLLVEHGGERTRVLGRYLPGVRIGDTVAVHRRFATDRLDEETAARYARRGRAARP